MRSVERIKEQGYSLKLNNGFANIIDLPNHTPKEHLPASTSFTLFIDGKEIMPLSTNRRGNADIKLSTAIKR